MPDRATPRLLVLTSTFPRGRNDGTPRFVRDVAIACSDAFDVTVLTPRVSNAPACERVDTIDVIRFAYFPRRFEDVADGATFENVRARPSRLVQVPFLFAGQAIALRKAIRRLDPDVLHIYWIIPQGVAALLVGRDRPWVVTSPGVDVYALNGRGWRAVKRAVLGRARVVTTMNADMRRRVIDLGAADATVLPMPADLDRVRRPSRSAPPVAGRILFAGRLVEKKGGRILLDALAMLGRGRDWSLHVVGDGPLRPELELQAATADLDVTFLGELDPERLAQEYGRCEVVVVPSVPARSGDQDGLPVVLLEAMAAGRAVIASQLPGIEETITDGLDGILVPAGDAAALAASLVAVLGDAQLRQRIGAAAAIRADDFSVAKIGSAYIDLLLRAARR